MKFRIHFEYATGTEDSFDVEAETIEEIRRKAAQELYHRAGSIDVGAWSEELQS